MSSPSAVFPGGIATDANLRVAANNVQTTLKVAAGAADTILWVNSVTGIPANSLVSIDSEIISVASVNAGNNQLIIPAGGRGNDGTTAAAHSAGATVAMLIDAWHHNSLRLEIEAIETALGPNPTQMVNVGKYNWPVQTPAQTLTAGSVATINLSPFPPGITATSVNAASVYITDSTGGNEAVQITGVNPGVSISIAAPVHNHTSGQWSIGPASGGAQECIIAIMGANPPGGTCFIPSSVPITVHAAIVVPLSNWASFSSDSIDYPAVIRAADYPSGDLFYGPGASGATQAPHLQFHNISISNGPSTCTGTAIHIIWGTLAANLIYCGNGMFMNLDSTAGVQVSDFGYYCNAPNASPFRAAIYINGFSSNSDPTDGRFSNGRIEGNWLGAGIEITGCDSWDFNTITLDGMQTLFLIDPPIGGGSSITNLRLHGMEFDAGSANNPCANGFKVVPHAGITIGSISLTAIDFLGYLTATEAFAINLGAGLTGSVWEIKITACTIANWNCGIGIGALSGTGAAQIIQISNCTVVGCLTDGVQIASPMGIIFSGNQVTYNQHYGINLLSGAGNGIVIVGNQLTEPGFPNVSGPINIGGPLSGTGTANNIVLNNAGIDDVTPAITTAAALTFPINPNFTLTGAVTGVTSVVMTNVPAGSRGTFRTTSVAVTFTAGGGIGNTLTTVLNVPVLWVWDGTSLWLK